MTGKMRVVTPRNNTHDCEVGLVVLPSGEIEKFQAQPGDVWECGSCGRQWLAQEPQYPSDPAEVKWIPRPPPSTTKPESTFPDWFTFVLVLTMVIGCLGLAWYALETTCNTFLNDTPCPERIYVGDTEAPR